VQGTAGGEETSRHGGKNQAARDSKGVLATCLKNAKAEKMKKPTLPTKACLSGTA